jgi:hypothetical protein
LTPATARAGAGLIEVLLVAALYIALAHAAVHAFDASTLLPEGLGSRERQVGGGFAVGALAQLGLLALLACTLARQEVLEAARSTVRPASGRSWVIALVAAAIHVSVGVLFFLPDPQQAAEVSGTKAMVALSLPDAWTQEVMFRGYIMLRLARSGYGAPAQIAVAAVAFGAIHVGYLGEDAWGAFWPLFGTITLGAVLGLSAAVGRGSLLPAVCAHAIIIAALQPWLALAS